MVQQGFLTRIASTFCADFALITSRPRIRVKIYHKVLEIIVAKTNLYCKF
ncbi:hypothetical protein Krac_3108 [Ktedonobacter racemifer DSM 44963]|uniref:Uncharacterized protein n=1 Tax=Ktedonobacter racemifer DSM 44963 TaxID=485913 RepID=D6U0G9_KTERA|nr:hypothetical protein Krac_3108 [Ktedonobacter racemifer DSM 44963]